MAANKRAKKNSSSARKRNSPRKGAKSAARKPILSKLRSLLVLGVVALIASYYFGSFALRVQIERAAIQTQSTRCARQNGYRALSPAC